MEETLEANGQERTWRETLPGGAVCLTKYILGASLPIVSPNIILGIPPRTPSASPLWFQGTYLVTISTIRLSNDLIHDSSPFPFAFTCTYTEHLGRLLLASYDVSPQSVP